MGDDFDKLTTTVVTIISALIGVAILAVIVSKNSNTAGVLQAGGSALGTLITTAVSPVSGAGSSLGSLFNAFGSTSVVPSLGVTSATGSTTPVTSTSLGITGPFSGG
jgi:hypothetical protein